MRHTGQKIFGHSPRGDNTANILRHSEHNCGTDEAADKCVEIEGVIRTLPANLSQALDHSCSETPRFTPPMKKESRHISSPIYRRAQLLHEACKRIAEFRAGGFPIRRIISSEARKLNGAPLGAGQRLKCSSKSMYRHFARWLKHKSPDTLVIKYKLSQRSKSDPLLLDLIVRRCMRTGESLSESVMALKRRGARITTRDVQTAANRFLRSIERASLEFLKQQLELQNRLLKQHALTQAQFNRERHLLEKAFLEASTRGVKQHASLLLKVLLGQPGATQ